MKITTALALILLVIIFLYICIVLYFAYVKGDLNTKYTLNYHQNYPEMPNNTINFTLEK